MQDLESVGGEPTQPPPPRSLKAQVRRIIVVVVGFTLILIGALFGLVPGIPGWPLGFLGLSMLAGEFVWAAKLLKRVKDGAKSIGEVLFPRRYRKRMPPHEGAKD